MPRHISLIFPGQGSQSIGMLNSFSEDELDNITKISKEVLDTDIVDCIKNGPEEDLNKTSITQPALLIASYLYYKKNDRTEEFKELYPERYQILIDRKFITDEAQHNAAGSSSTES